jgi:hypothetical protein
VIPLRMVAPEGSNLERALDEARAASARLLALPSGASVSQLAAVAQRAHEALAHLTTLAFAAKGAAGRDPR